MLQVYTEYDSDGNDDDNDEFEQKLDAKDKIIKDHEEKIKIL